MGTVRETEKDASGVGPEPWLRCLVTEQPGPESEQGGVGAVLEATVLERPPFTGGDFQAEVASPSWIH